MKKLFCGILLLGSASGAFAGIRSYERCFVLDDPGYAACAKEVVETADTVELKDIRFVGSSDGFSNPLKVDSFMSVGLKSTRANKNRICSLASPEGKVLASTVTRDAYSRCPKMEARTICVASEREQKRLHSLTCLK